MSDLVTYVESHLGLPWVSGAHGPHAFDCWGWAQALQRECFGRGVETIAEPPTNARELIAFVRDHAARKQWKEVEMPVHGGLVEMAHYNRPFHIGVYLDIDGGGISHSAPMVGVTFDSLLALRASGWRKFTFHDWIG